MFFSCCCHKMAKLFSSESWCKNVRYLDNTDFLVNLWHVITVTTIWHRFKAKIWAPVSVLLEITLKLLSTSSGNLFRIFSMSSTLYYVRWRLSRWYTIVASPALVCSPLDLRSSLLSWDGCLSVLLISSSVGLGWTSSSWMTRQFHLEFLRVY